MAGENVADRLKLFIESRGLTYSQFADSCGIPRPSLSQLLTGRNKKINDTMVRQIHTEFPDLSIVWLLFGEGPMEEKKTPVVENTPDDVDMGIFNSIFSIENKIESTGDSKNLKSFIDNKPVTEFSKENAANDGGIKGLNSDRQVDILKLKVKELTSEIERLKKNPRKVAQITLYYDDSTFETFVPFSKDHNSK